MRLSPFSVLLALATASLASASGPLDAELAKSDAQLESLGLTKEGMEHMVQKSSKELNQIRMIRVVGQGASAKEKNLHDLDTLSGAEVRCLLEQLRELGSLDLAKEFPAVKSSYFSFTFRHAPVAKGEDTALSQARVKLARKGIYRFKGSVPGEVAHVSLEASLAEGRCEFVSRNTLRKDFQALADGIQRDIAKREAAWAEESKGRTGKDSLEEALKKIHFASPETEAPNVCGVQI